MPLDTNIRDYDPSVQGPIYVPPSEDESDRQLPEKDSGASSIEKSKTVVVPVFPFANFPTLQAPTGDDSFSKVVSSIQVDGPDHSMLEVFIMSQQLKLSEVTNDMLDAWNKNLREIEDEVRRTLQSPYYQALLQIRLTGGDNQANVSGIQSVSSANRAESNPASANANPNSFVSSLDRLNAFERIPPAAVIPDPNDPKDASKLLTIPLVATMVAGGSLVLANVELSTGLNSVNSTPLLGTMEIVDRMQPLFPQLLADVIPMINLMVMPLIYYASWDAAIGSLRNKEADNSRVAIQEFAKQVIKMVSDPAFVLVSIVNKMQGADQLTPERKNQLAAILKLILSSVALSLLYSFDVGKVQGNKFWGMEPQEFKALLSGEIKTPKSGDPNLTTQQQSSATLLALTRAQLDALPAADKENAINILFDYLGENRSVEDLLDPSKAFHAILTHAQFNAGAKGLETSQA